MKKRSLLVLVLAAMLLGACDESVNPIVGTERPFTVFGFFASSRVVQTAIVIPIRDRLDAGAPTPTINAEVRSIDLDTGDIVTWQDSLVVHAGGERFDHVFFATFRAMPRHRYRLEVTRSDGAQVVAEATVPPTPAPVLADPLLSGQTGTVQQVVWERAAKLIDVVVEYRVGPPEEETRPIRVPYEGERVGDDWVVIVDLARDFRTTIQAAFILDGGGPLSLEGIRMDVLSVDEAWDPPGGDFDLDLLVQPGTFSNVDNGFGFVGAGVEAHIEWLPDDEVLQHIGYVVPEE